MAESCGTYAFVYVRGPVTPPKSLTSEESLKLVWDVLALCEHVGHIEILSRKRKWS